MSVVFATLDDDVNLLRNNSVFPVFILRPSCRSAFAQVLGGWGKWDFYLFKTSQTKMHAEVSCVKFNAFGLMFWMNCLRQAQQLLSTRTLLEPSGQRDFGQTFFEQSGIIQYEICTTVRTKLDKSHKITNQEKKKKE